MPYYESWDEFADAYAIDIDDEESYVLQPPDLLLVMGEMIQERGWTNIYTPQSGGDYPPHEPMEHPFYYDAMLSISNYFSDAWRFKFFVKNVDSEGKVIDDPAQYEGLHISEVQAWTKESMEEYIGFEEPIPNLDDLSNLDWIDVYPDSRWFYWHFKALSMMRFSAIQNSYDTEFTGYVKEGTGATFEEATANFNAAPWVVDYIFEPGNVNLYYIGHASQGSPGNYTVTRNKLEDVSFRMPQTWGGPLQDKNCILYHVLLSEPVGTHQNRDYLVEENCVYVEGVYEYGPTYTPSEILGREFDNADLEVSPVGDIPGSTVQLPSPPAFARGYKSPITHRNIQPSWWGTRHVSMLDWHVYNGYTYQPPIVDPEQPEIAV